MPSGGDCVECNGYNWGVIVLFAISIWVAVLVLTYVARPHPFDLAYFQIIVYFLQVCRCCKPLVGLSV